MTTMLIQTSKINDLHTPKNPLALLCNLLTLGYVAVILLSLPKNMYTL